MNTCRVMRGPRAAAAAAAWAVAAFLGTGCSTQPQLQPVKVPIAVECRAQVPDRPAMPTDALTGASALDAIVAAALAEIELRKAYELKLVAALEECTRVQSRAP